MLVVIEPKATALAYISLSARSVLVLDAVQDPGNVGTMIRTAHGLGAAGVIALPGSAELVNPKVLRATMGAAFRMPAVAASHDETLKWLAERRAAVWIAAADGEPISNARRLSPVALVVGNEGAGISAVMAGAATMLVAVPLAAGAESLNVGVAAGILLYEALRDV